MSVGYPDYARLDRAGGYLLYEAVNATPPYDFALFKGYVGAFPYITLTLSCNFGTDTASVNIQYYSDATFATAVGRRIVNRVGTQFSVTQYANLSEWAIVYYTTVSGNPVNFVWFTVYGSSGPATQAQLVSMDVPIFQFNAVVANGAGGTNTPQHVQPGPAVLNVSSAVTPWYVELLYYDIGAAGYLTMTHIDNTQFAVGGIFTVALLDAPLQIAYHNGSAAPGSMRISLASM